MKKRKIYAKKPTKRIRRLKLKVYLVILLLIVLGLGYYMTMVNHYLLKEVEAMENVNVVEEEIKIIKDTASINRSIKALENSPMKDAIPYILKASEYYGIPVELYVGIANAESSLKNYRCYNPWGVDTGKGQDPRCYNHWEHAVNGFSQLIKYYYLEENLITPEQLRNKYVGYNIGSLNWSNNVRVYYNPVIVLR